MFGMVLMMIIHQAWYRKKTVMAPEKNHEP
jgi:hypothetical protein